MFGRVRGAPALTPATMRRPQPLWANTMISRAAVSRTGQRHLLGFVEQWGDSNDTPPAGVAERHSLGASNR